MYLIIILCSAAVLAFVISGFRIIRPYERGLVETFGRATGIVKSGLHWRIPAVQRVLRVCIREQRLSLGLLGVITSDNMSAVAGAEITVRLKDSAETLRAAYYSTDSYFDRTVSLAQAALLDIVGDIPMSALIVSRRAVTDSLFKTLAQNAAPLGVEVLRADLKEIEFAKDVRESIHSVLRASNERRAADDFASAAEKAAEAIKRADIRKAEGKRQARILEAEGNAKAIRLICEASRHYFIGTAQLMNVLVSALNSGRAEPPTEVGAAGQAAPVRPEANSDKLI
jgi:regulator of protease activity HflC (stomatin/prohibitin superfamily)